jgi:hypothetical protein
MMFVRKVKKESKLSTGSPTLHMRLPSLCMQALGLRYSTVWANRAGGQSTIRLWLKTSPQVGTASPVNREILLDLLNNISLNSIIQGWAKRSVPNIIDLYIIRDTLAVIPAKAGIQQDKMPFV